ncbi:MAG: tRNA (N6-isopentenyl adenosine(37)-C2)-methylthiotransferase MiaB [Chloroflexi bacterium RBG_13_51_52]|nr:MAG: tRNA (N6-isopentenyl adenosine(37)-C2)-methylthiotransferase MiaB [Chloroflexi bacterium RBG_13_51_52]
MPKYHIWTIGCQMNKAESERIAARFEELGYGEAKSINDADLIVLNSCVVRQSAENRVINKLHDLKHLKKERPDTLLALTGCMVDSDTSHLHKSYQFIDHFFKAGEYPPWLEKAKESSLPKKPAPSVYVPISQGCDNFCSYCIVPYRRGRERSKPMEEVVCEVKELARRGAKEVILLGQNVDSYGHDLKGKPDLADLLTELNEIEGVKRLRFLTNHPKDMSLKLIKDIARLDKVCEQVNLPVQAGSDEVLKAMKRGYTVEQYRRLVRQIREKVPDIAISTDVIVGFPGESEGQFKETLDLLSEIKFDTVHVAAYSPRAGTAAAREYEDDTSPDEKKERLNKIEKLQEGVQSVINARLMGEASEILVEGKKGEKWYGRTRTDKLVFFSSNRDYYGQLVKIKIEKTSPWSLQGKTESVNVKMEE